MYMTIEVCHFSKKKSILAIVGYSNITMYNVIFQ